MTLQQLFREVEFEDLIPHLLEKGPKSKGNLARFNEAFDIARRMKNVASDGETIMVEFTEGSSAKVESVCFAMTTIGTLFLAALSAITKSSIATKISSPRQPYGN